MSTLAIVEHDGMIVTLKLHDLEFDMRYRMALGAALTASRLLKRDHGCALTPANGVLPQKHEGAITLRHHDFHMTPDAAESVADQLYEAACEALGADYAFTVEGVVTVVHEVEDDAVTVAWGDPDCDRLTRGEARALAKALLAAAGARS